MGKNFEKIRKRTRLRSLLSAVSIGLGAGVSFVSVAFMITKAIGTTLSPVYYIAAVVVAVSVGLILYAVLTPSDARLAKRLDEKHSLDEKIRTMVAFKDSDDAFAQLQREDADDRLSSVCVRLFKSKQIVSAIAVVALSLLCVAGTFLVPARAEPVEAQMSDYDKTELLAGLSEIIDMVESSLMEDGLKQYTLDSLNGLVAFVESHTFFSEMRDEAILVLIGLDAELDGVNSAAAIGEPLVGNSDKLISNLGKALAAYSGGDTRKALTAISDSFSGDEDAPDIFANKLELALSQSGVSRDDTLYSTFKILILNIRDGVDLDDAFDTASREAVLELSDQNINAKTMNNVMSRLCQLFDITDEDLVGDDGESITTFTPSVSGTVDSGITGEDPDGADDNEKIDNGGYGKGDTVYRDDDEVYDPDRLVYRPYYDMVGEYSNSFNEQYNDGKIDDDIAQLVEQYYVWLLKSEN